MNFREPKTEKERRALEILRANIEDDDDYRELAKLVDSDEPAELVIEYDNE